jgi:hypothetical protein
MGTAVPVHVEPGALRDERKMKAVPARVSDYGR